MLSDETLKKVTALQAQLKRALGDAIWLTPPTCLHVTLMEIIWDADYKGKSRKKYFEQWYKQYGQVTKEVLASCSPITLHFTELIASPRAIIIKAENPEPLNTIRAKLLSRIELPKGTRLPPDIAHCSIARYNKSIDVQKVRALSKPIDFNESITQFKLMNDLVPPDFNPKCVEVYNLASWRP